MKLVKTGKVKDVYEIDLNTLEFVFSDRISVFDKIIPSKIPHKGEVLARISAYWFKLITELGVPNHYIDSTAPNRMRVKRVKVIHDYKKLNSQTTNYLIPLECVVRYYLYGSLWDRITKNLITPETLGFQKNHEMKFAEPLPKPFFEVTTKLEKVDRLLEMKESLVIAGISKSEFEQIKEKDHATIVAALINIGDIKASHRILFHLFNHGESCGDISRMFGDYSKLIEDLSYLQSTVVSSDAGLGGTRHDYQYFKEKCDRALNRLCGIKTPIANNLLRLISQKRDIEVTESVICGNSSTCILSYKDQRNTAEDELKRRGDPPYDESVYLNSQAWKL